ncbi:MAG TPA: DNA alkylation repair protein [Xanthomonadales bacterium]|nr:DNA alkylation repair protein [Xanthomonadales bacterium]
MTTTPGVPSILAELEKLGTKANRDGLARYGITTAPGTVFGVPVGTLQKLAKHVGRDHALALALWDTGWYEARLLAAFVDEPARVTPAQMDRWAKDFDSWAVCDTACMHLFDRTPHAWKKVAQWSRKRDEFVKRAAFALLASLALHDRKSPDAPFADALALIEREATDERNFVKKAVNWALRGIGERSVALNTKAMALATRLAASEDRTERWIGKDALRSFRTPAVQKRLVGRTRPSGKPAAKA